MRSVEASARQDPERHPSWMVSAQRHPQSSSGAPPCVWAARAILESSVQHGRVDKRDARLSTLTLTAGSLILHRLEKGKHSRKKPLSSRTESLHLILVLFPSFLEHWLSHIDGALTFALSEPPLHTIMSPLRPLVLIYVFDAGSLDFNSIRETLELNGFPA